MKKLLMCLFIATMLTGCGGSSTPVKESKTCNVTEEGLPFAFKMNAVDNEIESVNMSITYENDFSSASDEQKAEAKAKILEGMGLEGDVKGITVNVAFTDTALTVNLDLDIKNADREVLKLFGLNGLFDDLRLDATVKEMEEEGAVCK